MSTEVSVEIPTLSVHGHAPGTAFSCRRRFVGGSARRKFALPIALCVVISLAVVVPSASAQFEDQVWLYHGQVYSSTALDAHTTDKVDGSTGSPSNHTWCPAMTQGVRGLGWPSYMSYSACGPDYQEQTFCGCIYTRGATYNPNSITDDWIAYAYWIWH